MLFWIQLLSHESVTNGGDQVKKLSLTELLKNSVAFTLISASAMDAGLLFADRTDLLTVPHSWYFNAPLGVWAIVGIPVSISLAERIVNQVSPRPGRIATISDTSALPFRAIRFTANGRTGQLLTHIAPHIFGEALPIPQEVHRPVTWRVPIDGNDIIVRESELRAFLDGCSRRVKHQFSRPYWTERRRPPLYRPRYEAFMRLLSESGLVEGRHAQGGASGRLVTKPQHAITYLTKESPFAVKPG